MEFGVQLYGLMPRYRENPEALVRFLAETGYRMAEPCVRVGEVDGLMARSWAAEKYAENEALLHAYGLTVPSCHVFAADLLAAMPDVVAFATRYGVRQLVINCPGTPTPEACRAFAETCIAAAKQLLAADAELLLHSNPADSVARMEGRSAYEWILDACGGAVKAQPDVGWLLFGGVDPADFLRRKGALVRSLHYKDVDGVAGTADAASANVCLGRGLLDARACYAFAREAGIPQIVDQDADDGGILSDMEASLRLLESFGE